MNILPMIALVFFSLASQAQPISVTEPIHSANEIVLSVYKKAGVKAPEVKIIALEYNYLKGIWHVELTSAYKACIDCYPAYYIKNEKPIIVEAIMHG